MRLQVVSLLPHPFKADATTGRANAGEPASLQSVGNDLPNQGRRPLSRIEHRGERLPFGRRGPWIGSQPKPAWILRYLGGQFPPDTSDQKPWPRTVEAVFCVDIRELTAWDILDAWRRTSIDCAIGFPP